MSPFDMEVEADISGVRIILAVTEGQARRPQFVNIDLGDNIKLLTNAGPKSCRVVQLSSLDDCIYTEDGAAKMIRPWEDNELYIHEDADITPELFTADAIATVLYNYDPAVLKQFLKNDSEFLFGHISQERKIHI